ncbi:MAG TPA: AbrB/MazE/SpoVT family DNA-binding domain-containing protein [Candidatus Nanoarchaeia archaeon]|nr:AbrB/MazE/SpoVT family DNA-binding domain-containing protein [Candidatus Nanoarchaeia archaeon]
MRQRIQKMSAKKKFMKKCYKCGTAVQSAACVKEGHSLECMKCPKCGEEYFTSSALIKHDILTGKRQAVRKFGILGDSIIMRIPPKFIEDNNIQPGDYGIFEQRPEGILIRLVHAGEN